MRKYTPWFDWTEQPVRYGVYEISGFAEHGKRWFRKWDGQQWHVGGKTVEGADGWYCPIFAKNFKWRGLARKP